jgi:two-component system, sporulation sensor kinase E
MEEVDLAIRDASAMKSAFLDKLLSRIDRLGPDDLQNYLQTLAREKGFLETIFNTLQEGILVVDPEGKIIYLNHGAQSMLGLRPEQALGDSVEKYVRDLDWPKILREQQVVSRDLEITYPDARYLSCYVVPLDRPEESPLGFALILHDLTERRERTRETIESEKINALTQLAAGVAHELGNPLNSLHIHFQLLERDIQKLAKGKGKKIQESLHVVRSEIERLDTIIDQFLKAVRSEPLERQPERINRLLEESIEFLQPEIRDRDLLVELELAEGMAPVALDAGRIKQAFYNLIKNAVQASRTGGILRITTEQNDLWQIITFEDNGSGVAPENVTRIFDPYFTTKKSGSGLGLLIVRRIVREHGGELSMESHEGKGTTVRIFLPLIERRVRLLPSGEENHGPAIHNEP